MRTLTHLMNSVSKSKIGKSLIGLSSGLMIYAGTFCLPNKSYAQAFDQQINISVGVHPVSVTIGDADNDGYNDIITANQISNDISFLRWNGNNFDSPITTFAGFKPTKVVIADADNDGKNEVVTANYTGNNVSLLRWNGTGFNSPVTFPTAPYPHSVAVGDLNNDGKNDIVTAHTVAGTVSLLLGNGTDFNPYINMKAGDYSQEAVIADADNDGNNDIIVANSAHGGGVSNISLFRGNGTNFDPQIQLTAGNHIDSVIVGDVNNDGKNEIVCTNRNDNTVSLIRWNETNFNPQIVMPVGTYPMSVAIGDADNDRYNDIVTANSTSDNISFLRWNGNGFDSQITMPVGNTPVSVAIGDADNDRYNDIVTANSTSNNISLIYGNKPTPVPTPTPNPVELISPKGGEKWDEKSYVGIEWKLNKKLAGDAVGVELWGKNGLIHLGYDYDENGQRNSSMFLPLMPGSDDYIVSVYSLWNPSLYAESKPITIIGKGIKLISPNGGEKWKRGSQQMIHWEANPDIAGTAVRFELWDKEKKVMDFYSKNKPNQIKYGWDPDGEDINTIIVPDVRSGSDYKIRVISAWDSQHWDDSDNSITIKK